MISILYIDDERSLLEIGKHFLEQTREFAVETVTTADEALDCIRERQYDAIISDYQLPGMNGIDLLKYLRKAGNQVPFIIFTGRSREQVVIEALNAGAAFYLQKGMDWESQFAELAYKVKVAVQHRETMRQLLESRERLSGIIEFFPDATLGIDRSGRVTIWNRAMEEMTGIPASEMIGKGDYAYTVPFYGSPRPQLMDLLFEPGHEVAALYPHLIRSGDSLMIEVLAPALYGGKGAYVSAKASPLRDSDGNIVGAIESIRDITELNRAQAEIRDAELFNREVINGVKEGIIVYDRDLKVTLWNRYMEEMTGIPYEEMMGKRPFELFLFLKEAGADSQARAALSGTSGESEDIEYKIPRTGKSGWAKTIYSPHYDINGSIVGVIAIVREITSRKKAEYALYESEERFRNIFNESPIALLLFDNKGVLKEINSAGCDLFGLSSPDEVRGTTFADNPNTDRDLLKEVADGKGRFHFETRYDFDLVRQTGCHPTSKDGTVLLEVYVCPICRDCGPGIEGVLIQMLDITDRKRAEEALRKSELRLRKFYESGLFGVIFWDINGTITDANDRFLEITGYTRDDLVTGGVNGFELTPPEYAHIDEESMRELLETGVNKAAFEKEYFRKDGSRVPVLLAGAMLDEEKTRGVGFVLDITDRKRAENALVRANRQLNLLTGITRHDIMNQVSVILGYLSLTEKESNTPLAREYLGKVRDCAQLINSHILFTRVYQDLGSHGPEWQDLSVVISRIPVPASLDFHVSPGGVSVFTDTMIQKVFEILTDNSVRHGQHVSEITISTVRSGEDLVILFEDNGTGIPEKEKSLIFERGYGNNTGFGLFLAREILALTGIGIRETGTPGKGARFEIIVPKGGFREREHT
jgi:PAS domain S-box-containing protein